MGRSSTGGGRRRSTSSPHPRSRVRRSRRSPTSSPTAGARSPFERGRVDRVPYLAVPEGRAIPRADQERRPPCRRCRARRRDHRRAASRRLTALPPTQRVQLPSQVMAELFLGGNVDPATHERTGDEIRLDTDTFTTHGVIVGMTGSGKTGLGVVLVEEVLSAGLPTLLIDPKGDLTNLCLTFPGLSATEFRPWVDEAQAKAAGVGPDEFAAQQAELWTKGLLGWGFTAQNIAALRASTDFTIYTPGSRVGRSGQHRRIAPGARRRLRHRDRRRRDRGLRVGAARAGRHRRRPAAAAASTSCSPT